LQLTTYVQEEVSALDEAVLLALNSSRQVYTHLEWVSPLESEGFTEYRDASFLEHLGLRDLAGQLAEFWPNKGPCWDALAKAAGPTGKAAIVLVEAKSHRIEVCGVGTGASGSSKAKIESALGETKEWLSVPLTAPWTGTLYQYANRLAHLYFFRNRARPAVDAWLVNIYFLDDPYRPTSRAQWDDFLPDVRAELKLPGKPEFCVNVFLPAIAR
jgi:hypothetical protein